MEVPLKQWKIAGKTQRNPEILSDWKIGNSASIHKRETSVEKVFSSLLKMTIFQLGEAQLKGLLERVNEQTQKTTTVKVRIFLYIIS